MAQPRRTLWAAACVWTATLKKDIQIDWNGIGHISCRREEPAPVLARNSSARTSSAVQGGYGGGQAGRRPSGRQR